MKLIAGLGNPGARYASTRHNVGWWFLDHLADVWGLDRFREDKGAGIASGRVGEQSVKLVKPLAYMNRSGGVLRSLTRASGFEVGRDLLVIVDDVALEPGRVRLRPDGSAGGHNGLKSVEAALGTRSYARVRIGVGSAPREWDLADWVLSRVPREERSLILDTFPDATAGVELWMTEGTDAAMNRVNR